MIMSTALERRVLTFEKEDLVKAEEDASSINASTKVPRRWRKNSANAGRF